MIKLSPIKTSYASEKTEEIALIRANNNNRMYGNIHKQNLLVSKVQLLGTSIHQIAVQFRISAMLP